MNWTGPIFLLLLGIAPALQAEASFETEGRLRVVMQMARERNDSALVSKVGKLGRAFKAGDLAGSGLETSLRSLEKQTGIDPSGWSVAGQPIFHPTPVIEAKKNAFEKKLAEAMADGDPTRVRNVVSEWITLLGGQAGLPDARRPGRRPQDIQMTEAEATSLFLEALKTPEPTLRSAMAGSHLPGQKLRAYGELLAATADIAPFAARHCQEAMPDLQKLATGCSGLLLKLQQADGHFPFPDLRGQSIRFGDMINRALARDAAVLRDGWLVSVDPDGGSQFDTGICGTALLKAGITFQQEAWVKAGLRAANWAKEQPCCPNFNYNAFSVSLLVHAFHASAERSYLQAALQKFRTGLAPGQAPNGRWVDPHNARTVYHVIILRALGDLMAVEGPHRQELDAVARPALQSLLDEFDAMGITVEALPALLQLQLSYPDDARLSKAIDLMAASLISKSTDGRRVKMGAQPNQLSQLPKPGSLKNR